MHHPLPEGNQQVVLKEVIGRRQQQEEEAKEEPHLATPRGCPLTGALAPQESEQVGWSAAQEAQVKALPIFGEGNPPGHLSEDAH